MENQVKELNVRIIDLETKSYASSSRPATLSRKADSRIEEITGQLTGKGHAHRLSRDSKFDFERQRAKLDDERKVYESQLASMRKSVDELVCLAHSGAHGTVPISFIISTHKRIYCSHLNDAQSAKLPITSKSL